MPIVAVDKALDGLSRVDERQSKVVEMKFFGGLSAPEIAEALGISLATVERDWAHRPHLAASRDGPVELAVTVENWERVKELLRPRY